MICCSSEAIDLEKVLPFWSNSSRIEVPNHVKQVTSARLAGQNLVEAELSSHSDIEVHMPSIKDLELDVYRRSGGVAPRTETPRLSTKAVEH